MEKDISKNIYRLTINAKQAWIIKDACDLYERIHAGQWFALSERLPLKKGIYPYMLENALKDVMKNFIDEEKLAFERISGDIMQVIRYHLFWDENPNVSKYYNVNSQPPIKLGSKPLPTIDRIQYETDTSTKTKS